MPENDIAELRTQLARLEERMNTKQAEYKTDIGKLASEVRTDINNLATEFRTDIGNLTAEMARRETRLLLAILGVAVFVVGILGVLIRWPVAG